MSKKDLDELGEVEDKKDRERRSTIGSGVDNDALEKQE